MYDVLSFKFFLFLLILCFSLSTSTSPPPPPPPPSPPPQIPEYCQRLDEQDVLDNAFDLIFAFDEIVALGYRENVNLAQIRTFTEMDSHEEKVYEAMRKVGRRRRRREGGREGNEYILFYGSVTNRGMLQSDWKTFPDVESMHIESKVCIVSLIKGNGARFQLGTVK